MSTTRSTRTALAAVGIILAITLGGCGAATGGMSSAPAADRQVMPGEAPVAGRAPAATKEVLPADVVDPAARKIARTATMTVTVTDVAQAAEKLRLIALSHGGLITGENIVDTEFTSKYSTITLSVAADQLDAALKDVAGVGKVKVRAVMSSDVTTKVADVDARVKTMRESIARLQALMSRAGTVGEIASIESELTRRQADLESLLAQQASLAHQVQMAPITVTLLTDRQAPPSDNPFLNGLKAGLEAFLGSISFLLTLVGGLLPFALVGALIFVPLWRWRKARRGAVRMPKSNPRPDEQPTPPGVDG